jgi:beta-fructofuranosidase
MPLKLTDKWVWDFWLARDGSDYHMFYLQAPNTLGHENQRHWNVSIGHAVSHDLRRWQILPDALRPSDPSESPEAFDSYTTWTGSVMKHAGLWYMFYTGGKRSENGLIQRVGLATSSDLMTWQKHPDNPVLEADPAIYELFDTNDVWPDQAWRDPYVFEYEGKFHAFVTARVKDGAPDARGVVGHATSHDLLHWQVKKPVTEAGEFGQLEVPQVVKIGATYYLLFCLGDGQFSEARKARGVKRETGTHYMVANNPLGPYRLLEDDFLVGDESGSLYAGRLVQDNEGSWHFMAFRNVTASGQFLGEITDPMPVRVEEDGRLRVTVTRED